MIEELLKVENLTPWYVVVYSGHAHWDQPIEELEASFCTREEAEDYAKSVCRYHPRYFAVVCSSES